MENKNMMLEMFQQARQEGLWFYSAYQQLWFSPDDLEHRQKNGQFCWGPENWRLRNPQERLKELQQERLAAERRLEEFEARLS